jgi:DNA helicase HerA-like ATPase
MIREGKVWIGNTEEGQPLTILPRMANRHGLIAGATGTGKTVTVKVLAESFSDIGVPVFLADVKGDLAGMISPGNDTEDMQKRISRFGIGDSFSYKAYPSSFWDIYGQKGIQLRTTISEFGPLLLSRVLGLNDLQSDIMTIIFKIADDHDWLLADTKDLKAVLNYAQNHSNELAMEYGRINSASIGAIMRALVALELAGGDVFFGLPSLNILDWLVTDVNGRGMITILDSESLINNPKLYSTFLLWFLSELFETLPEVGDLDKPRMVFFFDEAHLLFDDTPKELLDKIEQVVKLIRSKGVGIYFCTQNPRDVPEGVLAQLGNKIQHALRAYTPAEQKKIKAAADSFRVNPAFNTLDVISSLGTGEAVVSFLEPDGTPGIAQKAFILPPQSRMGSITDAERTQTIQSSLLYTRYANAEDPESAYEILIKQDALDAEEAERKAREAEEEKAREREEKERQKEEAAKARQEEREKKQAEAKAAREEAAAKKKEEQEKAREERKKKTEAKKVGKAVTGTVGREVGKGLGAKFGSLGKKIGGNLGAQLGRGILDTFFK